MAVFTGNGTEYYPVVSESLWRPVKRGTVTECYGIVVMVCGGKYIKELVQIITLLLVRVCGEQYREELVQNVILLVVRVCG